jgi:hypothetical protein
VNSVGQQQTTRNRLPIGLSGDDPRLAVQGRTDGVLARAVNLLIAGGAYGEAACL